MSSVEFRIHQCTDLDVDDALGLLHPDPLAVAAPAHLGPDLQAVPRSALAVQHVQVRGARAQRQEDKVAHLQQFWTYIRPKRQKVVQSRVTMVFNENILMKMKMITRSFKFHNAAQWICNFCPIIT